MATVIFDDIFVPVNKIDINITPSAFRTRILHALSFEINQTFIKAVPRIESEIKTLLRLRLIGSKTYQSLTTGILLAEFGLDGAIDRVTQIIDQWVNSVLVTRRAIRRLNNKFTGGLTIGIVQEGYQDVLALSEATVVTSLGEVLPWLKWLLLEGSKIIIREYDVRFGRFSNVRNRGKQVSRTGEAIMVRGKNRRWGVPAEFSGTANRNWITDELDDLQPLIDNIVEKAIIESIP